MGRLQAIEKGLIEINDTVFQELCDSFLKLRNSNYAAFSRTGTQAGKQKSTKGTPDSFFLLPNDKYIFVEHSTNISAGLKKLVNDIDKCLDQDNTGIRLSQIAEIILCINFKLEAAEIQSLKQLLSDTAIQLTIYTLDALSVELHLHHRDLLHIYLRLPLDTGQVVSTERFVEEYNKASKGISTPLNNRFLHRAKEVKALMTKISFHDFIIVTGWAGVGKTKLCLEVIKRFIHKNPSYQSYCVSYKSHTLIDDLYQYLQTDKDYILFVDDANRIDALGQILGFYKTVRRGKLKVILTVRDYAYEHVKILSQGFLPERFHVSKLSDDQVIDIIKSDSFNISDKVYHREIARIADGNPRLAIMAVLLSMKKKDLYALINACDLFDKYFSTFIMDDEEFAKPENIKIAGLIAFFHIVAYKEKSIIEPILQSFKISYSNFIERIDRLDKLELLEIQFDFVKASEQNLATYFFYMAFIESDLLSFDTLVNVYFQKNPNRFKHSIMSADNSFDSVKVMAKLKPALKRHLDEVKENKRAKMLVFQNFWFYLPEQALEFLFDLIKTLPYGSDVTNLPGRRSSQQDDVLQLLSEFYQMKDKISDALELALEYVKKRGAVQREFIESIIKHFSFDLEDKRAGFERQMILIDVLTRHIGSGDPFYSAQYFELIPHFLQFSFVPAKTDRVLSFRLSQYDLPASKHVFNLRKKIWNALYTYFPLFTDEVLEILNNYAFFELAIVEKIVQFDAVFIARIIKDKLDPSIFQHCLYVQNLAKFFQRHFIPDQLMGRLKFAFVNPLYSFYIRLMSQEKNRAFELHGGFYDDDEFIFTSISEVEQFYTNFSYVKPYFNDNINTDNILDTIIEKNISIDFSIGLYILELIIYDNNKIRYCPDNWLFSYLDYRKAVPINRLIQSRNFEDKYKWELMFYGGMEDTYDLEITSNDILRILENIDSGELFSLYHIECCLRHSRSRLVDILTAIYHRNCGANKALRIDNKLFTEFPVNWHCPIDLIKKVYLQQLAIDDLYDFDCMGMINILKQDKEFILELVTDIHERLKKGISGEYRSFGFIWDINGIESELLKVFDLAIEKNQFFGVRSHFCNVFYLGIPKELRLKADQFLLQYLENNSDCADKINAVVNIARNSRSELFQIVLLKYISLNQDVRMFAEIWWRGAGGKSGEGVFVGDLQAADWRNIMEIVGKSEVGINLIPIKKYISEQIDLALRDAGFERIENFIDWR